MKGPLPLTGKDGWNASARRRVLKQLGVKVALAWTHFPDDAVVLGIFRENASFSFYFFCFAWMWVFLIGDKCVRSSALAAAQGDVNLLV